MGIEFLDKLIVSYPWVLGVFVGGITAALFVAVGLVVLLKSQVLRDKQLFSKQEQVDKDDFFVEIEDRLNARIEALLAKRDLADERMAKSIEELVRSSGIMQANSTTFNAEILRMRDNFHKDIAPKIQVALGMAENNKWRLDQLEPVVKELTKISLNHETRLHQAEKK